MHDKPYFLTNPDWYYRDEEEGCYVLTDEAPEEARKSYEEFYAEEIILDDDGNPVVVDQ